MGHQFRILLGDGTEKTVQAEDVFGAGIIAAELASGKPFSVARIEPTDAHRESGLAKLIELGLKVEEVDAILGK